MSDNPNQEGDEDDGQDHPQADVRVQQQLRLSHTYEITQHNRRRITTRLHAHRYGGPVTIQPYVHIKYTPSGPARL